MRNPWLLIDGGAGLDRALAGLWPNVPTQRCTVHKHRNLLAHAPEALHEELTADYNDMIYAETSAQVMRRRKLFLAKSRLKCRGVADSLEEAGDRLFTCTRLPQSQWRSARTTNAIERLHEEFKRRIKTQTVLPSAETAAMLFIEHGLAPEPSIARLQDRLDRPWGMFAGGCHINRRIDALIRQSGFRIEHLAHDRMPGPRIYNYLYEGKARPE